MLPNLKVSPLILILNFSRAISLRQFELDLSVLGCHFSTAPLQYILRITPTEVRLTTLYPCSTLPGNDAGRLSWRITSRRTTAMRPEEILIDTLKETQCLNKYIILINK